MAVVLVECVEGAGSDRKGLAAGQVLDLALPLETVAGFEVVLVPQHVIDARLDCGLRHGETEAVAGQGEALTRPAGAAGVAFGAFQILQGLDDHPVLSSVLR